MDEMILHYDKLIEEENDPVRDAPPLQAYMDRWDGAEFLRAMELSPEKRVLEIGVGTGRLAIRVAPKCKVFTGIDISEKTIARAKENLAGVGCISLVCGDFLTWKTDEQFDVIYSSLTFLHIKEKRRAVEKVAAHLAPGGRFVLSMDKDPNDFLEFGARKIRVYPDSPEKMAETVRAVGLRVERQWESEAAYLLIARKESENET